MPRLAAPIVTMLTACSLSGPSVRAGAGDDLKTKVIPDIEYARVGDHVLALDLHLPLPTSGGTAPPLLVWVHGGAWRYGSKEDMPLTELVREGYAVASVDYRLSPVARFPAQIHDIKAAIRFLRANSEDHGVAAERIGIAGASAGGHLAALVGVTASHADLEGEVGDHLEASSAVQAIIDLYGPTNFLTILPQSTPHGLGVRIPALQLLLGAQPEDAKDLARLASPVTHVEASDPPLYLIHGDQDPQVPINQSHELHAAYQAAGLGPSVRFEVVAGAAHGGEGFYTRAQIASIKAFLDGVLMSGDPSPRQARKEE